MVGSILVNYLVGLQIAKFDKKRKFYLVLGVALNLLGLGYFKYANFFTENVNSLFTVDFENAPIHLPIGISFFTFQSISYLIDVSRKQASVQRNPINLALYISLFPQLIAGPIVRYTTVAGEIINRKVRSATFYSGVIRFIEGLAKKVLLANPMGQIADKLLGGEIILVNTDVAWLGVVAYSLQIYFDFSGYSDMAIGLGRMFGFHFLENFNFPYISKSIQEFWRRWHISLSSWFKDYLYIPLGGNRGSEFRTYTNLIIVFLLTGFWHGASWSFIVWGLFHGIFLIIERLGMSKLLKFNGVLSWMYTITVVMVGWVFFRIEELNEAIGYLKIMFIPHYNPASITATDLLSMKTIITMLVAIVIATGVVNKGKLLLLKYLKRTESSLVFRLHETGLFLSYMMIFVVTVITLATSTYNPFIYFRF
jgi:alginate O-acetyltransferase complex protein AlgI